MFAMGTTMAGFTKRRSENANKNRREQPAPESNMDVSVVVAKNPTTYQTNDGAPVPNESVSTAEVVVSTEGGAA